MQVAGDETLAARFGAARGAPLGSGAYASVYVTTRGFAIKQPLLSESGQGVPVDALNEMALLRNLVHPNVVRVLGVALVGATQIVMPLYSGTLSELIAADAFAQATPESQHARTAALYHIMRGAAFLHARCVVHLDIKPQNLLVQYDRRGASGGEIEQLSAQRGAVLLGDFGISRGQVVGTENFTSTAVTLYYRPPELLVESVHYGAPVDVWSVGVVWYQMLLGSGAASADKRNSLFTSRTNDEQLRRVFRLVGSPAQQMQASSGVHTGTIVADLAQQSRATLSPYELDLLMRTLRVDPATRITAQTALKHLFFEPVRQPIDERLQAPVLPAESECGDLLLALEWDPVGDYLQPLGPDASAAQARIDAMVQWLRQQSAVWYDSARQLARNGFYYEPAESAFAVFARSVDLLHQHLSLATLLGTLDETLAAQTTPVACFAVAFKMETRQSPGFLGAPFSEPLADDIVRAEQTLLRALDVDIDRPTAATFLRALAPERLSEARSVLRAMLYDYDTATQWRWSQLAFAAARAADGSVAPTQCMQHYEQHYSEWFAPAIIVEILRLFQIRQRRRQQQHQQHNNGQQQNSGAQSSLSFSLSPSSSATVAAESM